MLPSAPLAELFSSDWDVLAGCSLLFTMRFRFSRAVNDSIRLDARFCLEFLCAKFLADDEEDAR